VGSPPRLDESGRVCGPAEVEDFGRPGYPCRRGGLDGRVRFFKSVFDEQVQVVALIEHFALHVGIQLAKPSDLLVLLRDKFLTHRLDLDVDIVLWKIEVGLEELRRFAVVSPLDLEGAGLVLPVDSVEVEESREFPFAVVGEIGGICL
jgi:hypothetical protein